MSAPTLEPPPAPPSAAPPEPGEPLRHDPMAPRPFQRRPRNSSKVNATISLVIHAVLIAAAFVFAAREGVFGKKLKSIAVVVVPKEKKPEPPKEKPKEVKKEQPKAPPKQAATAPKTTAPPPVKSAVAPPPAFAPAAAPTTLPSFQFSGGKDVTSDPVLAYKGLVEYALRTRWNKPEGMADDAFVAEVNVTVDPAGKLTGYQWLKGSNDKRWDDSVKQALGATKAISRPPPAGFPEKFLVRFDVEAAKTESLIPGR